MVILGLHTGHDAAAALYADGRLVAYCKEERLTRIKQDGRRLLLKAINEVYEISGINREHTGAVSLSRMHLDIKYFRKTSRPVRDIIKHLRGKSRMLYGEMIRLDEPVELNLVRKNLILRDLGLKPDTGLLFTNHHYAHVLGAFQYTTWEKDALFISSDGGGDGATYSAYAFDGKHLKCIYGLDIFNTRQLQKTSASIGVAYQVITKQLGFRANRHEGKITGLAAYGRPVRGEEMAGVFIVNNDGSIDSRFDRAGEVKKHLYEISRGLSREDIASSIQYATEKVMVNWVTRLLEIFPARYIGMSGGVFSNVRLNQKISELPGIEEIYVFPPMGDEGLPLGNCANVYIEKYGLHALPRHQLAHVYYGRRYTAQDILREAHKMGFWVKEGGDVPGTAACLLADNKIGAIYARSMEMGPRALGARSILANPKETSINKVLNERLERTEFMPFAPYVLAEDAEEVFGISRKNREACRFMTITTDVRRKYHDLIPAVVHVDGTARPQIIERSTNSLYYEILEKFKLLTGIPCLVNTSFNAHEEPIINTPEEALRALQDNRIDFLIAESGIIFLNEEAAAPIPEDKKR